MSCFYCDKRSARVRRRRDEPAGWAELPAAKLGRWDEEQPPVAREQPQAWRGPRIRTGESSRTQGDSGERTQ